jgi:hypothetical protein
MIENMEDLKKIHNIVIIKVQYIMKNKNSVKIENDNIIINKIYENYQNIKDISNRV